nr:hypothetical protein [uncultured Chryseobacterium sp.]
MKRLIIDFTIGSEKLTLLNLLDRIDEERKYSYYMLYGYRQYVISLDKYLENCTELKQEHNFFKIKNSVFDQIPLIIDMFKEFQICTLIVSKENLDYKKYNFSNLRLMDINSRLKIFKGYEITEIAEDFLIMNQSQSE